MLKDYFNLAYRSAKKRKLRSWLTMLGIFIGIAAVVSLISLSEGMQVAIMEQFASLGSDKLVIQSAETGFGPPGTGVTNALRQKDEDAIKKITGVTIAVGRLLRSARVEFEDEVKFDYLVSIPDDGGSEEIDLVMEANNYKLLQGRMLKKGDKYKTVLGLNFGDKHFEKPVELRDKILIEGIEFEVIGILEKTGRPFQDDSILLIESVMRDLLDIRDEFDLIAVQVDSEEEVPAVELKINKELRSVRNVDEGKEDFTVQTPGNILATLGTILMIVQGVLVGIAGISLLVGGIGIMNTMYTAVLERTKEIGIMKATGARNRQIMLLFLVESGLMGFTGGVIGISLGYGISKFVEIVAFQIYGSYLVRAHFSFGLIFGMLLFAFLIGSVSGVFPARQAAKLEVVDALRK
ncbi:MAG: ABC transporter permease [Candidatus Woesearchaeota archaeon]